MILHSGSHYFDTYSSKLIHKRHRSLWLRSLAVFLLLLESSKKNYIKKLAIFSFDLRSHSVTLRYTSLLLCLFTYSSWQWCQVRITFNWIFYLCIADKLSRPFGDRRKGNTLPLAMIREVLAKDTGEIILNVYTSKEKQSVKQKNKQREWVQQSKSEGRTLQGRHHESQTDFRRLCLATMSFR